MLQANLGFMLDKSTEKDERCSQQKLSRSDARREVRAPIVISVLPTTAVAPTKLFLLVVARDLDIVDCSGCIFWISFFSQLLLIDYCPTWLHSSPSFHPNNRERNKLHMPRHGLVKLGSTKNPLIHKLQSPEFVFNMFNQLVNSKCLMMPRQPRWT